MRLHRSRLTNFLVAPTVTFALTASPCRSESPSAAQSPDRATPSGRAFRGPIDTIEVPQTGESVVQTELIQLSPTIEPGKPFDVGIRYTMARNWHLYWKNPGDSGAAPSVEWTLPEGFSAGPLAFPRPSVMQHADETTIGYDGTFVLKTTITAPADKPLPSTLALKAKLNWFVCSTRCLMGSRDQSLTLVPSGFSPPAIAGEYPTTLEALGIAARVEGETLVILRAPSATSPIADGTSVRFLPGPTAGVSYGATVPAARVFNGPDATLSIPLEIKPQNSLGEPLRVAGLITLTGADGKPAGSAECVIPLKHLEAPIDSTPPKSPGGKP